ncbi:hypothetical protein EZS27_030102, partial [termite gut metagenome]
KRNSGENLTNVGGCVKSRNLLQNNMVTPDSGRADSPQPSTIG